MNVSGYIFFLHGGIQFNTFASYIFYVRSNMSHSPSAAICHTATKCNGILGGRFNLYYHPKNICLSGCGPTEKKKKKKKKKKERHYFRSSPHTLSASQVVCSWLGTSTAEKPSGVESSTTTLHSCVCRRGSELFQIKLL